MNQFGLTKQQIDLKMNLNVQALEKDKDQNNIYFYKRSYTGINETRTCRYDKESVPVSTKQEHVDMTKNQFLECS